MRLEPLELDFLGRQSPTAPGRVNHVHRISHETDELKIDLRQQGGCVRHQLEARPLVKMVRRFFHEHWRMMAAERAPSRKYQSPLVSRRHKLRRVLRQQSDEIRFRLARRQRNFAFLQWRLRQSEDRRSFGPIEGFVFGVPRVFDMPRIGAAAEKSLQCARSRRLRREYDYAARPLVHRTIVDAFCYILMTETHDVQDYARTPPHYVM